MLDYMTYIDYKGNYQIWLSVKGEPFRFVESKGDEPLLPPTEAPSLIQQPAIIVTNGSGSDVWFTFQHNCKIVVRCFQSIAWTEQECFMLSRCLYPYYAERQLDRQNHILNKMMESIRQMTSVLELEELLTQILSNALAVIPVADMGVLWMFDDELDVLTARAFAGQFNESVRHMRMKCGEGIIGMTYEDGIPRLYRNMDDIIKDSMTMSADNMEHLMHSNQFTELKSIVSVPIKVEGKRECVLIVYQNGAEPLLTEEDMGLLQSFSDQVTIALTNARLYDGLSKQNRLLMKRDEIHRTLMQLSLQNKGAETIVRELGRMSSLPLLFFDMLDDTRYPIRKNLDSRFSMDELERLASGSKQPIVHPIHAAAGSNALLYIHPIYAANACLGFIAIELLQELTPLNQLIMEQGSSILALELVRKQSLSEFYYKKTNDEFNELLLQKDSGTLRRKGAALGIGDSARLQVALFEIILSDMQTVNVQVHRLVAAIKRRLGAAAPIVFGSRNKVTVLLSSQKAGGSSLITADTLHVFVQEWERNGGAKLRISSGASHEGLTGVAKSYNEADKAMNYMESRGRSGYLHYSDIGINRLFIHHSNEEVERFTMEIFEPLRSHKGESNRLEETLIAYMASNRSAGQAAERLHIHINTLYQRIKKIEDILNVSFEDQEHLLRLQLACYLHTS